MKTDSGLSLCKLVSQINAERETSSMVQSCNTVENRVAALENYEHGSTWTS